ncbi:porphobilinogen synthase [Tumebacillus sp. BK434]|uniref:porphobilinogen synthase n=1 Tax=Tumebacillus sp. BK434 TaxID=2512169 RepID=UPI001043E722|nr:porphobilinogen synthase [Tumebacillus sp. BK434]TCP54770.1 porphobilinogen synthase [Tumebacillus sp. BK434]
MNHLEFHRHRRLRSSAGIRAMVRENHVTVNDLIHPLFVVEGSNIKHEIPSMPNVFHFSLDNFRREVNEVSELGIQSIILFGVPDHKDECSSQAYAEEGIVQKAIRVAKEENPNLVITTDVCLCQYNPAGHCGIVENGEILNDPSLELIAKTALSHAQAGADIVAPSDMMDGRIAAIRHTLDQNGFLNVPVISYAVKYASAYYGPFREAAHSTPAFGDRKTYQMDPANSREALREAASDVAEGADMLMVKPALSYMDIIRQLRDNWDLPIVAYNVSAEYAMVKAAAQNGWIDERALVMETMTGFKRAGADLILTYFSKDIAGYLKAGY